MGCDIHCYIEYDLFKQENGEPYMTQWAHPHVSRDYVLFATLSGPRWEPWMGMAGEAKGLEGLALSIETFNEYHLRIDDEHPDKRQRTSSEHAAQYVKNGASYVERFDRKYVTHPDWHSASWLTAPELEAAMGRYHAVLVSDFSGPGLYRRAIDAMLDGGHQRVIPKVPASCPEIEAILAAMKVLDGEQAGRSRLVFWFDN